MQRFLSQVAYVFFVLTIAFFVLSLVFLILMPASPVSGAEDPFASYNAADQTSPDPYDLGPIANPVPVGGCANGVCVQPTPAPPTPEAYDTAVAIKTVSRSVVVHRRETTLRTRTQRLGQPIRRLFRRLSCCR
jgi:hypothetical protein